MNAYEKTTLERRNSKQERVGECLRGHKFLGACMCLEFQSITTMSVLNIMFIGDLFLIGLLLPFGRRQRVTLYPARVFTGTQVLSNLHVFRFQKDHYNEWRK